MFTLIDRISLNCSMFLHQYVYALYSEFSAVILTGYIIRYISVIYVITLATRRVHK